MCQSQNPTSISDAKDNINANVINGQIVENLKRHQSIIFMILLIIAVVVQTKRVKWIR